MSKVFARKSLCARPYKPVRLSSNSKSMAIILAISMVPMTAQSTPPDSPGPNAQGYVTLTIATINAASEIAGAIATNAAAAFAANTYYNYNNPLFEESVDLATTAAVEASASSITGAVSTAFEGAVAAASDALAQSAAQNVGTTPYPMNFGGAQRDTVAGLVGNGKAIITLAIAIKGNYSTTTTGKYVIGATTLAGNAVVDVSRFYAQEYLKAWLINRMRYSETNAAWLAFATSQLVGAAFVPVIAYSAQWGVAQYYTTNTTQRRMLLSEVNTKATNAADAFNRGPENVRRNCESSCSSPDCRIYSDYVSYRNSIRRLLDVYDDVLPTWQGEVPRTYADAYPAQSNIGSVARADLKPIFDAIYKTRIATCNPKIHIGTVSSSYLQIKCPYSANQHFDVTLNPLSADAQGNVVVTRLIRDNKTGRVNWSSKFTINRSNINTANYR